MTRQRWGYVLATLAMVAVAVVGVLGYRAVFGPSAASAARATHDQTALAVAGQPAAGSGTRPRRASRDHRPSVPPDGHVDVARVEAALARLQATTARISPEQLAEEQKRMAEAKARFEAIKVPEPKTREFTDDHGIRWIELTHASGEVRYVLAPEPEEHPVGAGSAR